MEIIWINFLSSIGAVFYLTTINYSQKIELLKEMTTNKVFLKLIKITTSKINFEQLQGMFKVYLLIMLITFLVYIIVIYIRKKSSHKVQKEIEFEHNKEIKRPAELARIRMGKLKN